MLKINNGSSHLHFPPAFNLYLHFLCSCFVRHCNPHLFTSYKLRPAFSHQSHNCSLKQNEEIKRRRAAMLICLSTPSNWLTVWITVSLPVMAFCCVRSVLFGSVSEAVLVIWLSNWGARRFVLYLLASPPLVHEDKLIFSSTGNEEWNPFVQQQWGLAQLSLLLRALIEQVK